jgi:hypothetical protein
MHPRARSELIALLVEGRFPIDQIRNELATYPWDADEPLVVLERRHVTTVLQRYLRGELTSEQVGSWAEALELRDDIGFPEQDCATLQHLIFVLANPDVNGNLTLDVAEALLATVNAAAT